jgi:hypothetical protein
MVLNDHGWEVHYKYANSGRATFALIQYERGGITRVGMGVAVCSPEDHNDPMVGRAIAMARALNQTDLPPDVFVRVLLSYRSYSGLI